MHPCAGFFRVVGDVRGLGRKRMGKQIRKGVVCVHATVVQEAVFL